MKENRQARETAIQSQEKKRRRSGKAKKEGKESQSLECQKKKICQLLLPVSWLGGCLKKEAQASLGCIYNLHMRRMQCAHSSIHHYAPVLTNGVAKRKSGHDSKRMTAM